MKKSEKICEHCKINFITSDKRRVTCSPKCSRLYQEAKQREYNQRPEIKAKKREYQTEYQREYNHRHDIKSKKRN